jgi:bla regulator protein blaR1
MTVTMHSRPAISRSETVRTESGGALDGPATIAATRVARLGVLLGVLGVASSLFVIARLLETWRVTSQTTSHRISIVGQALSYPVANVAAVVVVLLAVLGLAVTALTCVGAVRELIAARRFRLRMGAAQMARIDDALVIRDERPHALCAGLLRPQVYVSTGAVAMLDEATLQAVLAHERHHARRRDPLRLAAGRVLARSVFFVPGLRELVSRQQALAELSADESAVSAAEGNRSALARAMLMFSDASVPDSAVGIDPARVDHLLGEPLSWRFPATLCLVAISVIAVLIAVAVLVGQVAAGSATLAPPFLSSQPCVVVLAFGPAVIGLGAFRVISRIRRGSTPVTATGE